MKKIKSPWGFDELMAIAAFRYCCGRQSYIVGICTEWLIENWENFSQRTKSIIEIELEDVFKQDDETRANNEQIKPLGDDCDRNDWEFVRKLWKK